MMNIELHPLLSIEKPSTITKPDRKCGHRVTQNDDILNRTIVTVFDFGRKDCLAKIKYISADKSSVGYPCYNGILFKNINQPLRYDCNTHPSYSGFFIDAPFKQ